MIGCDILIILHTLKFQKLATSPFEFLTGQLLKIKYYENERKYVEVLVDIKEFEPGDLIQLKVFNYDKFVKVFNVRTEENFMEIEKCEDCNFIGCLEMDCLSARMAFTVRSIF